MEIALTAAIGLTVANAAFGKDRLRQNIGIIMQYRPRHFLAGVLVLAAVSGTAWGLMAASPVFGINPVLWAVSELFHAGNGQGQPNLVFSGLRWKWYAVIFLPVLALALPRLAQAEEAEFRAGTRNWVHGFFRSLSFGLAHVIMLIPLGASLALTIGGLWLTFQYFKGGTGRSTIYHAASNTIFVVALFTAILVT